MIPNMINIILVLLKYYRSKSSFLTFCAGYRSHYVCNDVSIWFAYKWSKMLTKKLAPCLKRFSIFQLTKCHQKTSVFTKCPRGPQKWTIAPALLLCHAIIWGHNVWEAISISLVSRWWVIVCVVSCCIYHSPEGTRKFCVRGPIFSRKGGGGGWTLRFILERVSRKGMLTCFCFVLF